MGRRRSPSSRRAAGTAGCSRRKCAATWPRSPPGHTSPSRRARGMACWRSAALRPSKANCHSAMACRAQLAQQQFMRAHQGRDLRQARAYRLIAVQRLRVRCDADAESRRGQTRVVVVIGRQSGKQPLRQRRITGLLGRARAPIAPARALAVGLGHEPQWSVSPAASFRPTAPHARAIQARRHPGHGC